MVKTLIWIGFSLLGVVTLLVAYAATLPNTFRVERSLSIKASPDKLIPMISDLKQLNEWNPFAKQDPSIKISYGQSWSGEGASYQWDSTGRAGKVDVSWSLSGAYPLINRVFGTVFNMDKMVGGEFEKGLSDLKGLAEK